MCGRFVRSFTVHDIVQELSLTASVPEHIDELFSRPQYNVAPTSRVLAVIAEPQRISLCDMAWGFSMAHSVHGVVKAAQPVINARSESVQEKPMFRSLVETHRCIIPMDGFYEWLRSGKQKVPHFISRGDQKRMWVAGLWRTEESGTSRHCVVLTKEATKDVAHIHNRTPVHFDIETASEWLNTGSPLPLVAWLNGVDVPQLHSWRVGRDVNSTRNDSASLICEDTSDVFDEDRQPSLFDTDAL
jgi:putative SOS response-associated peptidase YedK